MQIKERGSEVFFLRADVANYFFSRSISFYPTYVLALLLEEGLFLCRVTNYCYFPSFFLSPGHDKLPKPSFVCLPFAPSHGVQ